MRRWMGWLMALIMAVPAMGTAQERPIEEWDLPRGVAEDVVDFFNRDGTIRFQGRAEVPGGRVIQGDVAVLGGPMQVDGEIEGTLVVVNGNLVMGPDARISGDVTVVGGRIIGGTEGIGGQVTIYEEVLSFRRRGERITYSDRPWRSWNDHRRWGRSYFTVRTDGNYNRVEGLPVLFGPVFRTEGPDYFRAEALAIWKSDAGLEFEPREWGYSILAEQRFGADGFYSIGGTAHKVVSPVEKGGLTDLEASLATFFLHTDYRDYYEREGFSAFLRYDNTDAGVRLTAEYRDEDHSFVPQSSPWSLRDNDDPWRPQPLVGEGRLRTVNGELRVDDRNDPDDPSDGWFLKLAATKGLSGDLTVREYWSDIPDDGQPLPASTADTRVLATDFNAGSVDLRRYARLGPSANLRVRGFVGGSIDGEPLPPQFQRTLGGEGSLPGYPLMSLDCGARSVTRQIPRGSGDGVSMLPVFAGYGCDRVALFQAEYRGSLTFNLDWGDDDDWNEGWGWDGGASFTPSWSVFFDAGRGWSLADAASPAYLGPDTETLMDVGVGFFLGDLGIYWAWPLNGDDRDVNFFIRIDHRF